MEQKDKLAALVNEVDHEAQHFSSFQDYLEAKGKDNGDNEEWRKAVNAAADLSSSLENAKAVETGESLNLSSANPASPKNGDEPKVQEKDDPKVIPAVPPQSEQLSHPSAPPVT